MKKLLKKGTNLLDRLRMNAIRVMANNDGDQITGWRVTRS